MIEQLSQSMEDDMRRLKRFAQVDLEGNEDLYETTADRWSRAAKHQLSQSELANADTSDTISVGDQVMHENEIWTIKIPQGPRSTIGIIREGEMKMVKENQLQKIDEHVMGNLSSMPSINRMMQLAGLEHSGSAITETPPAEAPPAPVFEDDASNALDNLTKSAQNMPEYKDNPEAARLYAAGSVLAMLGKSFKDMPPQTVIGQQKMQTLGNLDAMGADLIQSAGDIAKGTAQS